MDEPLLAMKGTVVLGGSDWRSRSAVTAALVVAVAAGVLVAVGGSGPWSPAEVAAPAPPAAGKRLADAPAALQTAVLRTAGANESAYAMRRHDGSLTASGSVSTVFGSTGPVVRAGSGELRLLLAGVGRGSRLAQPGPAAPSAGRNTVTYRHGSVTEWYRNDPGGPEQGFTLGRGLPAGAGRLTIAVRASGALHAVLRGSEIVFAATAGGSPVLRYGGLRAVDARGQMTTSASREPLLTAAPWRFTTAVGTPRPSTIPGTRG